MGDATPPGDRRERPGKGKKGSRRQDLRPALAVLSAVFGDRMPRGALNEETVPTTVLAIPVAVATEHLIQHAKNCQNLACPHVPPPLRRYRRMRTGAIRKAADEVHKVLWTHPDHELVRWVRDAILAKHADLAEEVSNGSILKGERLPQLLDELGSNGPRLLAAVLWASEFEGPEAEAMFRLLIPLAADGARPTPEGVAVPDDGELKSAKAELRRARKDRKQAERTAEQAEQALRLKERALARSKRELEETQQKYRDAAEELDGLQARVRETDTALRSLERDGEKAARVNADLRRDLRRLQQAQRDLEIERSDLARKLAAERREVEHLKLALAGLPRGSDAVWAFLRDEEDRIQADRVILAGVAKAAADNAWTAHRKLERAFLDAYPSYRKPPPVKIRRKTPLRLITLGGSGEVGRSCYLVELGKHRILVDCGIKPSATEDLHPDIERLDRIDALVLTHAHTDHIGWVPALVRKLGDFDIYCSDGTAALLPVMLEDIRGHYVRKMAVRRKRAQYIQNAEIVEDEYEDEDVRDVPDLAIKCEFDEEEPLPFGDGRLHFYRAGHILGAASVLIEDQSGRRIFFSGDFSSFPQLTVPAARWPEDLEEIDLLVLESTYGGREPHPPLEQSRRELISFVRENIEGREGSVILASFALGRAQELLSLIAAARQSGELPVSVPVHVDGMIKKINPIYRRLADFDISPDAFNEVVGETERQEVAIGAQQIPSIIVTTSGMLTGGPVVEYARRLLPDPRHRIVLTGYQDEGAPSRNLREITRSRGGPRIVEVTDEDGELVQFEAALPAKEVRLSSHADQPGLLEYARRLRPRHIALVHGEPSAQEELRSRLLQIHPGAEISCGPSDLAVP